MSEELYGSGPYLDELFDFEVGATGDLRGASGLNELEKDLAFQMAITLGDLIGRQATRNFEAKLKDRASKVALSDSRIESVLDDNIEVNEVRTNNSAEAEYELVLPVVASGEQQELVFNL